MTSGGIEASYRKPNTSRKHKNPHFLRNLAVTRPNQARCADNIFIERLWRSLKDEEAFTKGYARVAEARLGIGAWLTFHNNERKDQALGYKTPREIFEAAAPVDMVDKAGALPTSLRWPFHQASLDGTFGQLRPQTQPQPTARDSNHARKAITSGLDPRAALPAKLNRRDSVLSQPVADRSEAG